MSVKYWFDSLPSETKSQYYRNLIKDAHIESTDSWENAKNKLLEAVKNKKLDVNKEQYIEFETERIQTGRGWNHFLKQILEEDEEESFYYIEVNVDHLDHVFECIWLLSTSQYYQILLDKNNTMFQSIERSNSICEINSLLDWRKDDDIDDDCDNNHKKYYQIELYIEICPKDEKEGNKQIQIECVWHLSDNQLNYYKSNTQWSCSSCLGLDCQGSTHFKVICINLLDEDSWTHHINYIDH